MLVNSVKSNLHHEVKPYYDEAVSELVEEGFLTYKNEEPAIPGVTLGSFPGYRITAKGVAMLS